MSRRFPSSVFAFFSCLALAACGDADDGAAAGTPAPPGSQGPSASSGGTTTPPGTTPGPASPGGVDPSCLANGYAPLEQAVSGVIAEGAGATVVSGGKLYPIVDGKLGAPKSATRFGSQGSQDEVERAPDGSYVVVGQGGVIVVDAAGKAVREVRRDAISLPISAAAIGQGGALYIVGYEKDSAGNDQIVVQRLTSDGKVDMTFGTQGRTKTASPNDLHADHLTIAPNGDLWVLGTQGFTPFVAKLSAAGTLDAGFGQGGLAAVKQLGPRNGRDLVLTKDGGAWVLGMTNSSPQIVKLLANGTPDPTFGTAGLATFDVTKPLSSKYDESVESRTLILQEDGKLVVLSSYEWDDGEDDKLEEESLLVLRASADGRLDETFGTKGVSRVTLGRASMASKSWSRRSATLLGGNRLLVGGTTYTELGSKGTQAGGLVCLAL